MRQVGGSFLPRERGLGWKPLVETLLKTSSERP